MNIYKLPRFDRRYKKLPAKIKDRAEEREAIFKLNPFDLRLETHKLHGKQKDEWSYSIGYDYRIMFIFLKNGDVIYTDVGTHDEVYIWIKKLWPKKPI